MEKINVEICWKNFKFQNMLSRLGVKQNIDQCGGRTHDIRVISTTL